MEATPGDSALASETDVVPLVETGEEEGKEAEEDDHDMQQTEVLLESFFAVGDVQHQERKFPQVIKKNRSSTSV